MRESGIDALILNGFGEEYELLSGNGNFPKEDIEVEKINGHKNLVVIRALNPKTNFESLFCYSEVNDSRLVTAFMGCEYEGRINVRTLNPKRISDFERIDFMHVQPQGYIIRYHEGRIHGKLDLEQAIELDQDLIRAKEFYLDLVTNVLKLG